MALSPKLIGPAIALITGLITSTSMSFVGLALNYGFQPDFSVRWLKAASTSYVVIVPMLMIVVPPIQRFVMRQAGSPHKRIPEQAGAASSPFERNPRSAT
jgi:O-antigen/teichoic acid export membrane protein